jgi:hypothetical protein
MEMDGWKWGEVAGGCEKKKRRPRSTHGKRWMDVMDGWKWGEVAGGCEKKKTAAPLAHGKTPTRP